VQLGPAMKCYRYEVAIGPITPEWGTRWGFYRGKKRIVLFIACYFFFVEILRLRRDI